jgi:hypothetical protein
MTHANLHLIQILPRLPDAENEHDYAWADSAYLDKVFRISLISQVSEVWLIPEKKRSQSST